MKFNSRQSYCILVAILLFIFLMVMLGTGWHIGDFPSGNDLRYLLLAIIGTLIYGAIFGVKKK